MLVTALALEALRVGLGFFLLGKVNPEKFTGAPLYMAGGGTVLLTRRDLRTPPVIVAGVARWHSLVYGGVPCVWGWDGRGFLH